MRGLPHEIIVWVLMLLGVCISVSGVWIGVKHLPKSKPKSKSKPGRRERTAPA